MTEDNNNSSRCTDRNCNNDVRHCTRYSVRDNKGYGIMTKRSDDNMARKTHASTEAKRRYNNKVYEKIQAELPKEIVIPFKEKCKAEGISQASIFKKAIEEYLEKND